MACPSIWETAPACAGEGAEIKTDASGGTFDLANGIIVGAGARFLLVAGDFIRGEMHVQVFAGAAFAVPTHRVCHVLNSLFFFAGFHVCLSILF